MAEPYYRIDHAVCDPLDLWDREAMVYSALLYLCKLEPYKGSANKLRLFCKIKSKTTVLRILSLLEEKALISRTPDGVVVNQYGSQVVHNGAVSNHSGANSKEKSSKKENNIKDNEVKVCVNAREETHTAASPLDVVINNLFHMDTLMPEEKPAIPANTGYYKIIVLEFGYLNPKKHIDDMYNFYNSHGWPRGGSKLELMRFWMRKFMERHPKQKPNLSETERLVMRTFLDNIEQRLIVRLFDVVTGFEVYEKKIVFVVKNENIQDFAKWLDSLPLAKIFAAYNRIVTVQPSKI